MIHKTAIAACALAFALAQPAFAEPQGGKAMLPSGSNATQPAAREAFRALAHVADNAALAAASTATYPSGVWRDQFSAARGGPAVLYRRGTSACSLNAGAGDDGSQVRSADSKCWLADIESVRPTPKIWGCAGDGVTDDTACFQAAVTAMGGRRLHTGPYLYRLNGTISSAAHGFELECESRRWVAAADYYGLRAGVANLNVLNLTGWNQAVRNCYIDSTNNGAFPTNTGGAAITMIGHNNLIQDTHIFGAGIGIDFAGNVGVIDNVRLSMTSNSLVGVRIGHTTTGGETVDTRLVRTVIECAACATPTLDGIKIEDAGGMFISQVDVLGPQYGTHISPGANQQVIFLTAHDAYLGDTGAGTKDRLWIDTSDPTAQVRGLSFINVWMSGSELGSGAVISNSGGGQMSGIRFIGARVYANALDGFLFLAGNDIEVQNSSICSSSFTNGTTYNGVTLVSGISEVRIQDNTIHAACDGLLGTTGSGIFLLGNNNNILISGNDLCGNFTAAISSVGTNPTGHSVIKNNGCIDDQPPNVIAEDPLLPSFASYQVIRGTTTPISHITPRWDGHQVTLVTVDGTINFNAGAGGIGAICNGKTAVPFVPFTATWVPGFNCWTLQ